MINMDSEEVLTHHLLAAAWTVCSLRIATLFGHINKVKAQTGLNCSSKYRRKSAGLLCNTV